MHRMPDHASIRGKCKGGALKREAWEQRFAKWRGSGMQWVRSMSALPDFTSARSRSATLRRLAALLEPVSDARLAKLARESAAITRQHFGKTIRLFAPLYVSNECINSCSYCGFSRDNPILRVTLEVDAVVREARHLLAGGFRNILLVAGEHPKFVSSGYLESCVRALVPEIP